MDYSNLFLELDNISKNVSRDKDVVDVVKKNCCDNTEIILDKYIYVCKNCGVINETKKILDNEFTKNSGFISNIFEPSKSTRFYIKGNNFRLKKINKWLNYNSKEAEANKCYSIIENMLEKIKETYEMNKKIFSKILHQSKLYWKSLYFDKKVKTRGKPRECLFAFCIIRSLIFYEYDFELLELLKIYNIDFNKYNTSLKKIEDCERNPSHINDYDWEGINLIIDNIFNSFRHI
jgi:hypothetical protein